MSATLRCRGSPRKRGRSSTSTLASSRRTISGMLIVRARAAAISMASGRPSTRRHSSTTAGMSAGPTAAPASRQRSRNSCTDGHDCRVALGSGDGEGSERQHGLARELERGAAGGEDRRLLAGAEDLHQPVGGGVEQVLAVVDDQEHGTVGRGAEQRVEGVEPQLRREGAGHAGLLLDAGEVDVPDAHREHRRDPERTGAGEDGLADPARADDGHQPAGAQPVVELLQLTVPSDERARWPWRHCRSRRDGDQVCRTRGPHSVRRNLTPEG